MPPRIVIDVLIPGSGPAAGASPLFCMLWRLKKLPSREGPPPFGVPATEDFSDVCESVRGFCKSSLQTSMPFGMAVQIHSLETLNPENLAALQRVSGCWSALHGAHASRAGV